MSSFADIIQWSPGVTLAAIERQVIIRAFDFYKKNHAQTARALDIDARTLKSKLARYELDDKAEQQRAEERKRAKQEFLDRSRGRSPAGQFDHAASRPVPTPQNGLNPTGHVPKEDGDLKKTPMPLEARRA